MGAREEKREKYGLSGHFILGMCVPKWVGVVVLHLPRVRSEAGEVAWGSIEVRACRMRCTHVQLLIHALASKIYVDGPVYLPTSRGVGSSTRRAVVLYVAAAAAAAVCTYQ